MEQQKAHYSFARDGFIYILSYITLMIFSVAANHLIKAVINPLLPKEVNSYGGWFGSDDMFIIGLIAAVIIAFPIYAGLNIWANKMLGNGQMRHNTGVRNWLIYLTMAVVVIVVISQLVYLLIMFLGGGLPVRVGIHALISILIALAVLGYQWWQLRFFDGSPKKLTLGFRIFEWSAIAVVLAALIWGFASIENPTAKRARETDSTRVSHLQQIERRIQTFYSSFDYQYDSAGNSTATEIGMGRLPQSFEDLANFKGDYDSTVDDPRTGERYVYNVTGTRSYELCATFDSEVSEDTIKQLKEKYGEYYYYGDGSKDWYHPAGYHCFAKTVTKQTR